MRGAFIIDAHDREVIAWRVVVNAGISGSDIRDMMLEAVERRFGDCRAPCPVDVLTDNGAPYTAKDTRIFAQQLGLRPCFRSKSFSLVPRASKINRTLTLQEVRSV